MSLREPRLVAAHAKHRATTADNPTDCYTDRVKINLSLPARLRVEVDAAARITEVTASFNKAIAKYAIPRRVRRIGSSTAAGSLRTWIRTSRDRDGEDQGEIRSPDRAQV
jgi:hypothetical protein